MKRVLRLLYCDPQSDLSGFSDVHVQSALTEIKVRLDSELGKTYRWLAACTVAVVAGTWGGERRRQRRIKLLKMANTCRTRLGSDPIVMENDRWASVGLYYGYGAIGDYGTARGLSLETAFLCSILDTHGPEAAHFYADTMGGMR
jgi:hypothetical protein